MNRGDDRMFLLIWTEEVMVLWKFLLTFVTDSRRSSRGRARRMDSRSS